MMIFIDLARQEVREVESFLESVLHESRFLCPLMKGIPTATSYSGLIENFSTVTKIHTLESGRTVFIIIQYPLVWVHRYLDTFMKWATKTKMKKASKAVWAKRFRAKSEIKVLFTDCENLIVLPFIPNVNLYDLIVNGADISDFGELTWAQEIKPLQGVELMVKVSEALSLRHAKGAWGEVIIQNIIVPALDKVIICDPEVEYYRNVSLEEAKARDLYDFCINASAAMNKRFNYPCDMMISMILKHYHSDDKEVILLELSKLCEKKLGVLERIFFGYTQVRLGLKSMVEYLELREYVFTQSKNV